MSESVFPATSSGSGDPNETAQHEGIDDAGLSTESQDEKLGEKKVGQEVPQSGELPSCVTCVKGKPSQNIVGYWHPYPVFNQLCLNSPLSLKSFEDNTFSCAEG